MRRRSSSNNFYRKSLERRFSPRSGGSGVSILTDDTYVENNQASQQEWCAMLNQSRNESFANYQIASPEPNQVIECITIEKSQRILMTTMNSEISERHLITTMGSLSTLSPSIDFTSRKRKLFHKEINQNQQNMIPNRSYPSRFEDSGQNVDSFQSMEADDEGFHQNFLRKSLINKSDMRTKTKYFSSSDTLKRHSNSSQESNDEMRNFKLNLKSAESSINHRVSDINLSEEVIQPRKTFFRSNAPLIDKGKYFKAMDSTTNATAAVNNITEDIIQPQNTMTAVMNHNESDEPILPRKTLFKMNQVEKGKYLKAMDSTTNATAAVTNHDISDELIQPRKTLFKMNQVEKGKYLKAMDSTPNATAAVTNHDISDEPIQLRKTLFKSKDGRKKSIFAAAISDTKSEGSIEQSEFVHPQSLNLSKRRRSHDDEDQNLSRFSMGGYESMYDNFRKVASSTIIGMETSPKTPGFKRGLRRMSKLPIHSDIAEEITNLGSECDKSSNSVRKHKLEQPVGDQSISRKKIMKKNETLPAETSLKLLNMTDAITPAESNINQPPEAVRKLKHMMSNDGLLISLVENRTAMPGFSRTSIRKINNDNIQLQEMSMDDDQLLDEVNQREKVKSLDINEDGIQLHDASTDELQSLNQSEIDRRFEEEMKSKRTNPPVRRSTIIPSTIQVEDENPDNEDESITEKRYPNRHSNIPVAAHNAVLYDDDNTLYEEIDFVNHGSIQLNNDGNDTITVNDHTLVYENISVHEPRSPEKSIRPTSEEIVTEKLDFEDMETNQCNVIQTVPDLNCIESEINNQGTNLSDSKSSNKTIVKETEIEKISSEYEITNKSIRVSDTSSTEFSKKRDETMSDEIHLEYQESDDKNTETNDFHIIQTVATIEITNMKKFESTSDRISTDSEKQSSFNSTEINSEKSSKTMTKEIENELIDKSIRVSEANLNEFPTKRIEIITDEIHVENQEADDKNSESNDFHIIQTVATIETANMEKFEGTLDKMSTDSENHSSLHSVRINSELKTITDENRKSFDEDMDIQTVAEQIESESIVMSVELENNKSRRQSSTCTVEINSEQPIKTVSEEITKSCDVDMDVQTVIESQSDLILIESENNKSSKQSSTSTAEINSEQSNKTVSEDNRKSSDEDMDVQMIDEHFIESEIRVNKSSIESNTSNVEIVSHRPSKTISEDMIVDICDSADRNMEPQTVSILEAAKLIEFNYDSERVSTDSERNKSNRQSVISSSDDARPIIAECQKPNEVATVINENINKSIFVVPEQSQGGMCEENLNIEDTENSTAKIIETVAIVEVANLKKFASESDKISTESDIYTKCIEYLDRNSTVNKTNSTIKNTTNTMIITEGESNMILEYNSNDESSDDDAGILGKYNSTKSHQADIVESDEEEETIRSNESDSDDYLNVTSRTHQDMETTLVTNTLNDITNKTDTVNHISVDSLERSVANNRIAESTLLTTPVQFFKTNKNSEEALNRFRGINWFMNTPVPRKEPVNVISEDSESMNADDIPKRNVDNQELVKFLEKRKEAEESQKKRIEKLMVNIFDKRRDFVENLSNAIIKPKVNHPKPAAGKRKNRISKSVDVPINPMKQPKLYMKEEWITNRLYCFVQKKLEPKYGLKSRVRSETFVKVLVDIVNEVTKAKDEFKQNVVMLKREMARLRIIETHHDFHCFVKDYLPFHFRIKAIPSFEQESPKESIFDSVLNRNCQLSQQ